MKKTLQVVALWVVMLLPSLAIAQDAQQVTIKDLNTYDNLTEYSEDTIAGHPLTGELVQFTAVVVSYPKSSGLATPNDTDNDGEFDDIGRIHVFVTDTNAVSMGREGMSMQIVESDYTLLEGYTRGDVITVTGDLGFFGATAQFDASDVELVGNVNSELPQYAELLDPWTISADELNIANENGTYQVNIENYSKYAHSYVKIEGATVSNVSTGDRPNWAINESGTRIYIYDTSLRYRNDRVNGYLPTYNFRRLQGEDGPFVPPAPGSVVNLSGFLTLNGDDPDGNIAADQNTFTINPMEDGVFYLNGERYEDGDDLGGGVILDWPNDVDVIGQPPVFSNVFLSDSTVTSSDEVTVSATVVGSEPGITVEDVQMVYTVPDGDSVATDTVTMSASGDVYTYTIPAQPNFSPVSFYFIATDSEGLEGRNPIAGTYNYFVQDEPITSISQIQRPAGGGTGVSPVSGIGSVPVNITATVVSDNSDEFIIIHDEAAAWGGIPIDRNNAAAQSLEAGDVITITSVTVVELENFGAPITYLSDLEFEVSSQGADIEAMIPSVTSDEFLNAREDNEVEAYEGMLIKFEDAMLTALADGGDFGEFGIITPGGTASASDEDYVRINDDFDVEQIGTSALPASDTRYIDDYLRPNAEFSAIYGVTITSFSNPKVIPRSLEDIQGDNWSVPITVFNLLEPADSAEVVVAGDLSVTWAGTEDYDGDDVTYEWVLYSASDTTEIVTVESDMDGTASEVTLSYSVVDDLLASAGLSVGESASFVWNVRVSDGTDTLAVANVFDDYSQDYRVIDTRYRYITLERSESVSNETEAGIPDEFALRQNYPNPFNPTTQIAFDLPQASQVKLTVFNMLGQKVTTIVNERMNAGTQTVQFDASRLSSGMYIYRLDAGTFTSTKKMMLIK